MEDEPRLIEPGIRMFLSKSLRDYHKSLDKYTSLIFNISLFIVFIGVFSFILYYRYKGRPTPHDIAMKNRKSKEYILGKLQTLAIMKKQNNSGMITDLPTWETHPTLG